MRISTGGQLGERKNVVADSNADITCAASCDKARPSTMAVDGIENSFRAGILRPPRRQTVELGQHARCELAPQAMCCSKDLVWRALVVGAREW